MEVLIGATDVEVILQCHHLSVTVVLYAVLISAQIVGEVAKIK